MAERKIKYLNMKSVQHEKTWQHEKSALSEKTIWTTCNQESVSHENRAIWKSLTTWNEAYMEECAKKLQHRKAKHEMMKYE